MSRNNQHPVPTGGETHNRSRNLLYSIGTIATGVTAGVFGIEAVHSFSEGEIVSGLLQTVAGGLALYGSITCQHNMLHPRIPQPQPPRHHP